MKSPKLNAKTRVSIGLGCILLSVLSTAMMLGLVPEQETAVREGRGRLCEAIALASSDYISHGERRRLNETLRALVERNPDLMSAGVRRKDSTLIAAFGGHEANWSTRDSGFSNETHVLVPIRNGGERWGAVELSFRPMHVSGVMGFLHRPWIQLSLFVCLSSFLLFQLYLKKMLAQLDPAKTVPKRVRTALDSLAEGLLVLDRHERIVLANQSFAEWLRRDAESLLGIQADSLNWDFDENSETSPWTEAMNGESVVAGKMIELTAADDTRRTLMANASPVLGHEGQCKGVLVSFDDVTQLEETKRDLTIAKRMADEANQAKSDFLARMSHEIRTPMNAILGYTDVLRRGFDSNENDRQEYLDTIHQSGEHLLALINDILDLSKVEAGQMELQMERCSPYALIKEVVSLLRPKADEKGINLEFRCEGAFPETILGDAVRLRQTIVNLVGNAIKFTERGGVEVLARLESRDTDATKDDEKHSGTFLAIDVIDTGIGISREALHKVFDPFAQADTSITRRFGGTGLGLAISHQLATAMGGGISVQSEEGHGTTFTLRVAVDSIDELVLVDAAQLQQTRQSIGAPATRMERLPGCRVLVADDGSPNRKLIRLVLGKAGAEVVTVCDGRQAVDHAAKQEFDLILMDMQMPVMDGYTATRELRARGYAGPIIALTANAMQGDREKCFAAGCTGFVAKPIKIDVLIAELSDHFHAQSDSRGDRVEPTQEFVAESTSTAVELPAATSGSREPILCSYPLDDEEFLEIATDFVARLQERLPAMVRAAKTGDDQRLAEDAHWLKGVSGSAGFPQFIEPSSRLEAVAKQRDRDQYHDLMEELRSLASRIDLPAGILGGLAQEGDARAPATEETKRGDIQGIESRKLSS
ncbi:response regulator [Roseiconus nitratireducens]|uniref:histidine kinase n=1 Tax=Roseiconus nitratireducens TaxID=2605748 RepID=A0A5M6DDK4_9BACT|nr:response regulator [Roseiconus nitratireducens]KAA5543265.1 response regulator [Roseiconus nitratireducens]